MNRKPKNKMQTKPKWPHKYCVTYLDAGEYHAWEAHKWICRAGDADHAEEKFIDSCMESDGNYSMRIISIKRIRERGVA